MKKALAKLSLMLLAGGVVTPAYGAAFPAGFGGTYCGGDNFTTCAWFSASIDASNNVTLKVKNVSGNSGSFFTAIGLANLGASGVSATNFSYANQGTATSNWTLGLPPNGLSGAGITPITIGAYRTSTSFANTLNDGEEVWFYFTLTGSFSLSNVQFAVHDQGGSTAYSCSSSTKLVVSQTSPTSGTWAGNPTPSNCLPPPTTVPEPGTIALLATGLVGLAGAGAVRRRKQHLG